MAVQINRDAPESGDMLELRDLLQQAQDKANIVNARWDAADAAQRETIFGIAAADQAAINTVLNNLVTAINAVAVNNYSQQLF